ncbi:polyprotein [Plakobranchus ocellatus]|uniref:Polyprotein n=1 Tax=Plakobranchus ocellatus TaxID=259542 RepID=A0AAV4DMR1_9GAST|nr:polyprotein [Plakobranchus ocellatus]
MASPQIPLPALDWSKDNRQTAFQGWKEFLESYFVINKVKNADKYHYLLLSSGPKGRELFQAHNISEEDKRNPTHLWSLFEGHMVERPNKWVQRLELQNMTQQAPETVDQFVVRLRNKPDKCSFHPDQKDDRITEQLIKGILWKEEKKKLISKGDELTLTMAIEMSKSFEASNKNLNEYYSSINNDIRSVEVIGMKPKPKPTAHSNQNNYSRCGTVHQPRSCPAFESQCSKCKKKNHWARMCKSSGSGNSRGKPAPQPKRKNQPQTRRMHEIDLQGMAEEDDDLKLLINAVDTTDKRNEVITKIQIKAPQYGNTRVFMSAKVDTGANGNILTERSLRQLYPQSNLLEAGILKPSKACTALGLVKVNCEVTAEAKSQAFSSKSISDIHEDYPDQFGGIGSFLRHFNITLKDDANPVVHATRKYPVHLQKELKVELDRMESLEVISKVTQPTDWVNSLAFSRKPNGKLRVCLDPKDLNKAIKRTYHKTPTLEEISHKFSGAKFFSKMDAQHGYWAIHLDDESSLLTTFNSPFGRYRFLRLPFGLKVSQDIFQQKMDQILKECPGTLENPMIYTCLWRN